MKKTKKILLILLALALALSFAACSSSSTDGTANTGSDSADTGSDGTTEGEGTAGDTSDTGDTSASRVPEKLIPFKIGYLASTGHVLYFVAKEKGYLEEEGLDAEMLLFNNSGEGINAVLAGQLDTGSFGTAPPFTFVEKGQDIVIFGGQMAEGHAIIAPPENAEALKDINGYKGKTIATVRLATGDIVLRAALAEAGIDWTKDLTINELGSPAEVLEAVKGGAADAGVVWSPYRKMAEDQGLVIVEYSDEFPKFDNHPCCRQIATGKNLAANKDAYIALQRALIKAYDFYQNDHEGTLEILAKYVATTPEILNAETYGEHGYSTPDPNINGVAEFWDAMKDANYITAQDIDIRDHVNTEIYETALNELLAEDPDNSNYKKLQAAFSK